jgi:excisionase family DNA binding protein
MSWSPMRWPRWLIPAHYDRLAYSIDEAAEALGLSRDLLYNEMRTGRLQYLKVGRRRIITRKHLDEFLTNFGR